MKTIGLLCASPASTAITTSTTTTTRRRPTTIDDADDVPRRRNIKEKHVPCSSHLPINPKPYFGRSRSRSSSSSGSSANNYNKQTDDQQLLGDRRSRRSSADILDLSTSCRHNRLIKCHTPTSTPTKNKVDYFSSDFDRLINITRPANNSPVFKSSSSTLSNDFAVVKSSSSSRRLNDSQIVELRVSVHCKGCEGKVRKQISKLEGVTSFSIDLATKKVTVVGKVSPLDVLTCISRVKNAQLWSSPAASSSSSMIRQTNIKPSF